MSENNSSDNSETIIKSNKIIKSPTIKDKCILSFLLHALGDKIGFKNSDWKINYGKPASAGTINEFICEFIDLGGINGIDISEWNVSADTMYNIAFGLALLNYKNKINKKFIVDTKNNLIIAYNKIENDKKMGIRRYEGDTTKKYLRLFTLDTDARTLPYDVESGGNGVASRSIPIGVAFNKESDLSALVELSITMGSITHNSPLGYLSGLTVSYFASLAMRNVDINLWPNMLIELLESDLVSKHIDVQTNELRFDYMDYVRYWKKYIDTKFVDNKPIKSRSTSNLIFRIRYYYENFVKGTRIQSKGIGYSGFCAVIMAYDALLDCDGKWEKVIFYAMLNPSDTSAVGAICGGLYGILYGFGDVPQHMLHNIEFSDELIKLGNKFYNKFNKSK